MNHILNAHFCSSSSPPIPCPYEISSGYTMEVKDLDLEAEQMQKEKKPGEEAVVSHYQAR